MIEIKTISFKSCDKYDKFKRLLMSKIDLPHIETVIPLGNVLSFFGQFVFILYISYLKITDFDEGYFVAILFIELIVYATTLGAIVTHKVFDNRIEILYPFRIFRRNKVICIDDVKRITYFNEMYVTDKIRVLYNDETIIYFPVHRYGINRENFRKMLTFLKSKNIEIYRRTTGYKTAEFIETEW
jgi:hypothetical protein